MTLMTIDLKDEIHLLTLAFIKRGAHIQSDPELEDLIQAGFSVRQVDKTFNLFKAFSAW